MSLAAGPGRRRPRRLHSTSSVAAWLPLACLNIEGAQHQHDHQGCSASWSMHIMGWLLASAQSWDLRSLADWPGTQGAQMDSEGCTLITP